MADNNKTATLFSGSRIRSVLFVDTENALHDVRRLFAEEAGVRLLTATSGEEALEIVRAEDVWLTISDTDLPGIPGIELLERIRHISPATGRILMAAHADLKTAIDAINVSEAFRFIVKPWKGAELKTMVLGALDRCEIIRGLAHSPEGAILSIAQAIELKDPYTRGHCDRVGEYASTLARKAGLPEERITHIRYGGWLHDCGKIGVPEAILNFPGKLNENGMKLIHRHPLWGAEIARQAELPVAVVNAILFHHEKFDGNGYPYGLKGSEITIEARIVTIADVFDSLRTRRPYRAACPDDQVREIMREMSDHFDPQLVELFHSIAEKVLDDDVQHAAQHHRKVVEKSIRHT